MQAPINSRLGKSVGSARRRPFSFLVGTAALVLILLVARGGIGGLGQIGRVPWWALVGGLLGAVYVSVALVAVRTLGASGLTAVVIGGQLVISVVIDRFGLLGVARRPSACSGSPACAARRRRRCSSCASSADAAQPSARPKALAPARHSAASSRARAWRARWRRPARASCRRRRSSPASGRASHAGTRRGRLAPSARGERRKPLAHRRGLVVDDVVGARRAARRAPRRSRARRRRRG